MSLLDTVLLDVDRTLIASTYHHATAWHRAFATHDLAIPMWRLHRAIGMGGDRLVAAVAGDEVESQLGDELRDGWKQEYERLLPAVAAFERAAQLLAELKRRGWRVALASSGKPDHTKAAIDLLPTTPSPLRPSCRQPSTGSVVGRRSVSVIRHTTWKPLRQPAGSA